FVTGINATKIIRNLQFMNSFGLSSLAFFLFWFFHFCNLGPVQTGTPPPVEGGRMGVGVFARLQHTPGIRQWDPRVENWVPICASNMGPESETGSGLA